MAKINLRTYNREIENLIESGHYDEAIAHCRHILKTFPKHVDTYRLLGKAYLESQRYGDAGDIFLRILSSVPDDFVAHVGMSIIREDEGNLDAAIWHMERAFEVQPSNSAIQDELRRLYGKRDGFEPPKIRLTRGALARMYAKGDLSQQAIAELRTALADDPQRLDLQVLLTRVLAQAGQRAEAADLGAAILRKLPFCLEANRIMSEILTGTEHIEDTQVYRQRVQALDPYSAMVSPAAPTPGKVPDQAITIERLEWESSYETKASAQPEWAATLGVAVEGFKPDQETVPQWLAGLEESAKAGSQFPSTDLDQTTLTGEPKAETQDLLQDWLKEEEFPQAEEEDLVPEWMKTAGWAVAAKGVEQAIQPLAAEEEVSPASIPGITEGVDEEIAQAEIPDWLQEIAPTPQEKGLVAGVAVGGLISEKNEESPEWLPEQETTEPQPDFEAWLKTTSPEAVTQEQYITAPETEAEGGLPEWLKELGDETNVPAATLTAAGIVAAEQARDQETEGLEVAEEETAATSLPTTELEAPLNLEESDAAFAWLETLAAQQGTTEGLLLTPDERKETPPEWIQESLETETSAAEIAEIQEIGPEPIEEHETKPWIAAGIGLAAAELLGGKEKTPEIPVEEQGIETGIPPLPESPVETMPPVLPEAIAATLVEKPALESEQIPPEAEAVPELPSWLSEEVSEPVEMAEWQPPINEVTAPPIAQPIEINNASLVELERLPGVGFILAQQIITYRENNGPFSSIDDLNQVPGISAATVGEIRDYLWVEKMPVKETIQTGAVIVASEEGSPAELDPARAALNQGDLVSALNEYQSLIKKRQSLKLVIGDLEASVAKYPQDASLWQALGDAYMRDNQLQEALQSYTKAEELLS